MRNQHASQVAEAPLSAGSAFASVTATVSEADMPLTAALDDASAALAMITGVEGTSYRPVGAAMVVKVDGRRIGMLSSGCIDADVALHAQASLSDNVPRRLRYGRGSPFADLQLPCGGGMDVLVVPRPDQGVLERVASRLRQRKRARIAVCRDGRISAGQTPSSEPGGIVLEVRPDLRILVFGKGPEATAFADLALGAGCQVELFSPDAENEGHSLARPLRAGGWPDGVAVDPWTAVALFFHDHDWEPPILEAALGSHAFYVGAQGSLRAQAARRLALAERGIISSRIDRLAQPFGLIPSARDPQMLAVSVLADIMGKGRVT